MLEKLKHQSLKKILIMFWNVIRVIFLKIRYGNKVNISFVQNLSLSTEIAISGGKLYLSHSVFTRRHVSFRVQGGEMKIGTSFFNQGCSITCLKRIQIGDNCLFGPNVVIVDHDHDYKCDDNQRGAKYLLKDVTIGNNVVIGANTVILKGTSIGDNCMIGAGSVVSGNIPPNTLIYVDKSYVKKPIEFYEK